MISFSQFFFYMYRGSMYLNQPIFTFFKHITVEPSYFIFLIVFEWMKGLDTNLFLQKSCRFNSTTEPDLSTPCDDEKRGILFISEVGFKYESVVVLSGILVTILATPWSDESGRRRRPLIYFSILGQIFHTLSGCLNSYFWQWMPTAAVIPWVLFESISGGICLMLMACQVYICDISDLDSRTMRLGFLGTIKLICFTVGKGGAGYILRTFGFFYSYLICFVLSVCGLLLGLIFIKDTSVPVEKKIGFCRIFNLKHMLLDSFKVTFNKNLAGRRIIVSLLMVANLLVIFTLLGELSVFYPYLRYRFGLDEKKFSKFMFYKFSGSALGILFCSVVLSKWLKIHDGVIGILAGTFDTAAIVILLFATQIWQLYLIPLIDVFHGTAMSIGSSFMSKYYDSGEIGRLYAVNGIISLLIPLSYPAYNAIFQKTIDSYPSAFCLLSIVLDVGIVLCFCVAYYLNKKFVSEEEKKPAVPGSSEENQESS